MYPTASLRIIEATPELARELRLTGLASPCFSTRSLAMGREILVTFKRDTRGFTGHDGPELETSHIWALPVPVLQMDSNFIYPIVNLAEFQAEAVSGVICGFTGKPLNPFYIPRRLKKKRPYQALFAAPQSLVSVADSGNGYIITEHSVSLTVDAVTLDNTVLFEGDYPDSELPEHLSRYRDALDAVIRKSQCCKCTHVHYSIEALEYSRVRKGL